MRPNRLTALLAGVALAATVTAANAGMEQRNFRTHLTGAEEVPAVDTNAQGQANFKLSNDGSELDYRVIVANIDDVMMAHLHLANVGENGPVVVWLYPDAPPPQLIEGRAQGTLATGTITDGDLVGPLAGMDLDDLVAAIRAGDIYVNIHTMSHPGGEIRGQMD